MVASAFSRDPKCARGTVLVARRTMPTSIGHALGGYAAADITADSGGRRPPLAAFLFLAIFVANVPDLDFVPGYLLGHAERFHRGASHSVLGGVLATLVLAPLAGRLFGGSLRRWAFLVSAVYASHLILDLLMRDPTGGPGIAFFWPFIDTRLALNIPGQQLLDPFRTLQPGFFGNGFPRALLRWNTVQVFLVDGILVAPLVLATSWWRSRARPRPDSSMTTVTSVVSQRAPG